MEQLESQLTAADVTLTADILDQIDQLVAEQHSRGGDRR